MDFTEIENLIWVVIGAVPFVGRIAYKVVRSAKALQIPFRKAVRGASTTFEMIRLGWDKPVTPEEIASLRAEKDELQEELQLSYADAEKAWEAARYHANNPSLPLGDDK